MGHPIHQPFCRQPDNKLVGRRRRSGARSWLLVTRTNPKKYWMMGIWKNVQETSIFDGKKP